MAGHQSSADCSGRRVLVAGAGGFIGRRLVARLVAGGAEVSALTRKGRAPPANCASIAVSSYEADSIRAALGNARFDWVFNLAAYGVDPADRDRIEAFKVNVNLARALAEAAVHCGAEMLLHAGSCSEYAAPGGRMALREIDPLEQEKLYGMTKAVGTQAVVEVARTQPRLRWVVPRIFGVYGPGEMPHRLFPALATHLASGRRVALSSGEQARDFMHVDDTVAGLIALGIDGAGVVNLCTGVPTTVRAFASEVARVMAAPQELLCFGERPYRPDDIMFQVGDTTRLGEMTAWKPAYSLGSGLAAALVEMGII